MIATRRTTAGLRYSPERREAIAAKRQAPLQALRTGHVVRLSAAPEPLPERTLEQMAAAAGLLLIDGKVHAP